MGLTVYGGGGKPEEEKTVTAGTSAIVVSPSSGKVMKKVTVNPTPTEEKTVTAGTSATMVTPTSGKYIKKVTVNPTPSQSKTVTPSTSQQTVSPDSGKLLSKVIVEAMEDVTPEVTAQTPVITQIAGNLGVTITTPSGTNKQILQGNNANLLNIKNNAKKEGLYAWKKCRLDETLTTVISHTGSTPEGCNVYFLTENAVAYYSDDYQVNNDGTITLINATSISIASTSQIEALQNAIAGKYIVASYDSPYSRYETTPTESGEYLIQVGSDVVCSRGGGYISLYSGTWTVYSGSIEKTLLEYIVSDQENAYPDGGEKDGYWYEKVVEGVAGIDFGEVTLASSATSVTVSHNLGVVPSWVALIPKSLAITSGCSMLNINGKTAYSGSSTSMRVTSAANTLSAEEITFAAYSSSYPFTETGYYWIAIA